MLELRDISCGYGKLTVVNSVSLEIGTESVGLFGPNGAGKTTLINAIVGLVKPSSGNILFDGEDITGLEAHEIARRGIALVPQDRELFPLMTVDENLDTGADYIQAARERKREQRDLVLDLFPALRQKLRQAAGTLSGGQQRMVAVGRALMANPRLLILDEPSLGLQPSLVTEMFERLSTMRGSIGVLVTEQNVRATLRAVDRGYVLENGAVAFAQSSEDLKQNSHVIKSYLGL